MTRLGLLVQSLFCPSLLNSGAAQGAATLCQFLRTRSSLQQTPSLAEHIPGYTSVLSTSCRKVVKGKIPGNLKAALCLGLQPRGTRRSAARWATKGD